MLKGFLPEALTLHVTLPQLGGAALMAWRSRAVLRVALPASGVMGDYG